MQLYLEEWLKITELSTRDPVITRYFLQLPGEHVSIQSVDSNDTILTQHPETCGNINRRRGFYNVPTRLRWFE